jgi:hypothetical protein
MPQRIRSELGSDDPEPGPADESAAAQLREIQNRLRKSLGMNPTSSEAYEMLSMLSEQAAAHRPTKTEPT